MALLNEDDKKTMLLALAEGDLGRLKMLADSYSCRQFYMGRLSGLHTAAFVAGYGDICEAINRIQEEATNLPLPGGL